MTLLDPQRYMLRLVFILGSLTALTPLAIDMYIPAFPQMADFFGVPVSRIELSLTTFFIGLAIGQLFYGTVSDKYGRKKPLYAGMLLTIGATIACAYVTDAHTFLALRFVQAIGICGGAVIARAMVRDMFGPQDAARFFSFLILVMGVAPILAPLAGGYIAKFLGWDYIFLFIGTFTFILMLVVHFALPETHAGDHNVKIRRSFSAYMAVLRDKSFLRLVLCGAFVMGGLFAYVTGSPFVFIQHFGVQADHFGWIFGTNALGFITMSQMNRYFIKNFAFEKILKVGFTCTAIASVALMLAGITGAGIIPFSIALFCFVMSMGVVLPNSAALALAEQGHRAGAASAMMGSLQFGLAFISSAIIGFVHAQTELPLALTTGGFGLIGVAIYFVPLWCKKATAPVPVQPQL